MKVLVTGARSGLGAYLLDTITGAVGFYRDTDWDTLHAQSFDLIIHCAVDARGRFARSALKDVLASNVELTRRLLEVPAGLFVFVSTVDVYPASDKLRREEDFQIDESTSLYGFGKLIAETLVESSGRPHLILRPTALLGPTMRKNSLVRVLFEDGAKLTLAADSEFNYVTYDQVWRFVKAAHAAGGNGIYNIASGSNVTLGEVAERFGRSVEFGSFTYRCGQIDNQKASALVSDLRKDSMDVVAEFAKSGFF